MGHLIKSLSTFLEKTLSKVMCSNYANEVKLPKSFWKNPPGAKPKETKTLADKLSGEQKKSLKKFEQETHKNFKDFSPY